MVRSFPQLTCRIARRLDCVGQHRQRRNRHQAPHPPVGAGHRHRSDPGGIAELAGEKLAVQHQPATDEIAKVEIQEILGPVPGAKDQLGTAGRCRIVLHMDGQAGQGHQFRLNVALAPGVHLGLGRADVLHPAPQLERHRDAHAANPVLTVRW